MSNGASAESVQRVRVERTEADLAGQDLSYAPVSRQARDGKAVLAPEEKKEEPKPPRFFHFNIRLGGRLAYSDNINASRLDPLEDFFLSLEPGLSIGIGDVPERRESYLRVDYSPNAILYADHSELNILQHFIHVEGLARFGKLSLTLNQDIFLLQGIGQNFDNPNNFGDPNNRFSGNRDVTGRNQYELYATNLGLKYELSERATLDTGLHFIRTTYVEIFTTDVYSGDAFLDYKFTPQLTVGGGGAAGTVGFDDPNAEEQFQEVRGRFTFDLPKKFNLHGSGGVEFRQFGPMGRSMYTAPIVEAGASYVPIEGTKFSVDVRHRTFVSNALAGQSFRVTGINVGYEQRITDRLNFRVSGGYETADYFSTMRAVEATRVDEFWFIDTSLELKITKNWTAGVFYIHRDQDSNLEPFGFVENQLGVRASIEF